MSVLADKLFGLYLDADIHEVNNGESALPCGFNTLKNGRLQDPVVLQIDEIVNVAASADNRYGVNGARMLKLFLSDGVNNVRQLSSIVSSFEKNRLSYLTAKVIGLEIKPILGIGVTTAAGAKV